MHFALRYKNGSVNAAYSTDMWEVVLMNVISICENKSI